MDMLHAHELRAAVSQPAQGFYLGCVGAQQSGRGRGHRRNTSVGAVTPAKSAEDCHGGGVSTRHWITSALSTSSRDFAPSIKAKAAFTAISEIPLYGSRAVARLCPAQNLVNIFRGPPG